MILNELIGPIEFKTCLHVFARLIQCLYNYRNPKNTRLARFSVSITTKAFDSAMSILPVPIVWKMHTTMMAWCEIRYRAHMIFRRYFCYPKACKPPQLPLSPSSYVQAGSWLISLCSRMRKVTRGQINNPQIRNHLRMKLISHVLIGKSLAQQIFEPKSNMILQPYTALIFSIIFPTQMIYISRHSW